MPHLVNVININMRTYTVTQTDNTAVFSFPYTIEPTPTIIRAALDGVPGVISLTFQPEQEPTATGTIVVDSDYVDVVCAALQAVELCEFVNG